MKHKGTAGLVAVLLLCSILGSATDGPSAGVPMADQGVAAPPDAILRMLSADQMPPSIKGLVWVDGTHFPTLASAYAAACTVMVPPNYAETLSADLTLNKSGCGFVFTGPATIAMGTHQVFVVQGVHGGFIASSLPHGGAVRGPAAVMFIYTGNAAAFQFGTPSSTENVESFRLSGIRIDLTHAGAGAIGMQAYNLGHILSQGVLVAGADQKQIGLQLNDGASGFGGGGTWIGFEVAAVRTAIQLNGSDVENTFLGSVLSGNNPTGSIGVDIAGGGADSNTFTGGFISGFDTLINIGSTANHNLFNIELDGATAADVAFGAATSHNEVVRLNSTSTVTPIVNGGGTSNLVRDSGGPAFFSAAGYSGRRDWFSGLTLFLFAGALLLLVVLLAWGDRIRGVHDRTRLESRLSRDLGMDLQDLDSITRLDSFDAQLAALSRVSPGLGKEKAVTVLRALEGWPAIERLSVWKYYLALLLTLTLFVMGAASVFIGPTQVLHLHWLRLYLPRQVVTLVPPALEVAVFFVLMIVAARHERSLARALRPVTRA